MCKSSVECQVELRSWRTLAAAPRELNLRRATGHGEQYRCGLHNIGREARHRLREGVVLHGAGPGPAQRRVEIARLLFVVDKIPKHERDRVKRDLLHSSKPCT